MSNVILPVAIVLMFSAVPAVPVLQDLEKYLRQYAHEMAYIPASALATAENLSTAKFDFSRYEGTAMQFEELRGVELSDFTQPRRSLEYAWARLCCLIYEQKDCLVAGGNTLDTSLLNAYTNDLALIESSRRSMQAEVAAYRAEKARNPAYTNDALYTAIRGNLHKLYILLGCAVRLKHQPHEDINLALRQLGFQLDRRDAEPTNSDLKLVALTLAAGFAAGLHLAATALSGYAWWNVTDLFPKSYTTALFDIAWLLIPYAAGILTADVVRRQGLSKCWWYATNGRGRRAIGANYIRVALACGVVGYGGLVLLGGVQSAFTLAGLKIDAPYALIAMVTGGFYAWHLDNVELGMRPAVYREIALQGGLTGLGAIAAGIVSYGSVLDSAGEAFDRIFLTAVISAIVGGALGWYLPRAAAAERADPLTEAREGRVRELEAAAVERLGAAEAAMWLDRQHPALGNKAPRVVAADVEGFEHALSLLQGPRLLAA